MKKKDSFFKVCVRCFTYNQSEFIKDTINGFCIQQTDFPFVCCIVDDASTDGEQDVIRQYVVQNFNLADTSVSYTTDTDDANVLFAQHRLNRNCYIAAVLLKKNHHCNPILRERKVTYLREWRDLAEYEAICEGDDYWTANDKLQIQSDFMDNNLEYGLCYTACKNFDQSKNAFVCEHWGGRNESFEQFLKNNTVPTLTVFLRLDIEQKYDEATCNVRSMWKMGDYPRLLWYSYNSRIKFLDIVTGVYRILPNSACHDNDIDKREAFLASQHSILKYFAELYGMGNRINDDKYYDQLHRNACLYGDLKREKRYYSMIMKPTLKQRLKHIICSNPVVYRRLGKKLFTTLS